MLIKCQKKNLEEALLICSKSITSRSPLPILSHFLFSIYSDKLKVFATDLELGIETYTPAKVEKEEDLDVTLENNVIDSFTAPAKILMDIMTQLPDAELTLEIKESQIELTCLKSRFTIYTLPAKDFPLFSREENSVDMDISAAKFKNMIKSVIFATADLNENISALTGVLFKVDNQKLTLVATDRRRISKIETEVKFDKNVNLIIPQKTMYEIMRLIKNEDNLTFQFEERQVFITIGNILLTSRLIEGNFPQFDHITKAEHAHKAVIKRDDFIKAVKRVIITAQERAFPNMIRFNFDSGIMNLKSYTLDLGEASEELNIAYTGNKIEIAVNGRFILDGLLNFEGDNINCYLKDSNSALILESEGENNFYLIMPIKIREEVYT